MRLINTSTYKLDEFFEKAVPNYAILSHRWSKDEVLYKDFVKGRRKDSWGTEKVLQFCDFARKRGHKWAWIDTVCIDKRNSAELSEAINSMYAWYAKSDECYAYLADVSISAARGDTAQLLKNVVESDWFNRGWTLQELLSPSQVIFLSKGWRILGRKRRSAPDEPHSAWKEDEHPWLSSGELQWHVSLKTGIPQEVLREPGLIRTFSVAQRMSWAAGRVSTREEDNAYCLLGLFDVNMTLLYGEGRRAFHRLQRKIIKTSSDETIYAWMRDETPATPDQIAPILASSPADFRQCRTIVKAAPLLRLPWTITNQGLSLPMPSGKGLIEFSKMPSGNLYTKTRSELLVLVVPLNCEMVDGQGTKTYCCLLLARLRCGHLGRIRTHRIDNKIGNTTGWKNVAVPANSTSRTSVFVHIQDCEDLKSKTFASGTALIEVSKPREQSPVREANYRPRYTTSEGPYTFEEKGVSPYASGPSDYDVNIRRTSSTKACRRRARSPSPTNYARGNLAPPDPHARAQSADARDRGRDRGYTTGGAEFPSYPPSR